jgi:hypothetical protein
MLIWWPIYPRFIRELFIRAFGTGLRDASLGGRITEGEWRRALIRLGDSVAACSCAAAVFWDADDPQARCWNCRAVPPAPPLLEIPGHVVVLSEGTVLTSNHLARDRDYRTARALVERHPRRPGEVVLRNMSDTKWTVQPVGEEPKTVKPQQRLGVRPMTIRFGSVRGSIRIPGDAR